MMRSGFSRRSFLRSPWMDFKHTHLCEADEALRRLRVTYCSFDAVFLIGNGNAADAGWKSHADVFLEEAGLAAAFGATTNAERAIGDMRQHVIGDGEIVVGKHQLGHPGFRVEDLVGMGDGKVGLRRASRFCGRGLTAVLAGVVRLTARFRRRLCWYVFLDAFG